MTNVVIRLVKKDEFEELMKVMNTAFNFVREEEKFEHILPKLYFKDNKNMIHYGAFVDGKLVEFVSPNDCIEISKVEKTLVFLRKKDYNFFKIVCKLNKTTGELTND